MEWLMEGRVPVHGVNTTLERTLGEMFDKGGVAALEATYIVFAGKGWRYRRAARAVLAMRDRLLQRIEEEKHGRG